jgi:multidrug efflux pump subunit AcrA (membrane-fusion protein)
MNENTSDNQSREPGVELTSGEKNQLYRRPPIDKRNLVIGVAAIALIALTVIALIVWRLKRSGAEEEAEVTPTVSVKVVKAEKGSIAAEISAVGTIWPHEKADVGAKISAQIKRMALLKNKPVRAGEVIAELESRDLQAQRAEAVAALNEARANERSPDYRHHSQNKRRRSKRPCSTLVQR